MGAQKEKSRDTVNGSGRPTTSDTQIRKRILVEIHPSNFPESKRVQLEVILLRNYLSLSSLSKKSFSRMI